MQGNRNRLGILVKSGTSGWCFEGKYQGVGIVGWVVTSPIVCIKLAIYMRIFKAIDNFLRIMNIWSVISNYLYCAL